MLQVNQLTSCGADLGAGEAAEEVTLPIIVGFATARANNGANDNDGVVGVDITNLLGGVGTAAQEGDYVLVFAVLAGDTFDGIDPVTDDLAPLNDLIHGNDSIDIRCRPFAKFMTSTPDEVLEVDYPASSNNASCVVIALVLRGVDPSTQMDVAIVPHTHTNTALFNPQPITPTTAGAMIVVMAAGGHNQGTGNDFTYPAYDGWRSESESDEDDATAMIAYWKGWESGEHDPPAVSWEGTDGTGFSAAGFTLAIRPAS